MKGREFLLPRPEEHSASLGLRIWHLKAKGRMPAAHTHPDIEVNYLTAGRLSYIHGGAVVSLEPRQLTVLWAGIPHCALEGGVYEGVWITLPLERFLQWNLPNSFVTRLFSGEAVSGPALDTDGPLLDRWVADFDGRRRDDLRAIWLEMEARFLRLATGAKGVVRRREDEAAPPVGREHIATITEYVVRHYQQPLTIGEIARAVGFHPKYLMRFFKQHSRMSLWAYITRMRLAHAQRLLLTSEIKILDLALEAGFGSLGSFYRAFAAYSPKLPRPLDYRRRLGNARANVKRRPGGAGPSPRGSPPARGRAR